MIEFLSSTWWMWLIGGTGMAGIGFMFHLANMKRTMDTMNVGGFFAGFGLFAIFMLIGGLCDVMGGIGLLFVVIDYIKGNVT